MDLTCASLPSFAARASSPSPSLRTPAGLATSLAYSCEMRARLKQKIRKSIAAAASWPVGGAFLCDREQPERQMMHVQGDMLQQPAAIRGRSDAQRAG